MQNTGQKGSIRYCMYLEWASQNVFEEIVLELTCCYNNYIFSFLIVLFVWVVVQGFLVCWFCLFDVFTEQIKV